MSDSSDDEVFQRVKSQNNKSFSKEDEETLKILKAEDKNEIKDESDETIEPKSFAELVCLSFRNLIFFI